MTTYDHRILVKNYERICECLEENSSYDLPEITYFSFDRGNADYLDWIAENATG